MMLNNLINRRIKNIEEDIIYRIEVLDNIYDNSEFHAGCHYTRVKKLSQKGKKCNCKPNVIHVNKNTYKKYVILDKLYNTIDETATNFLHNYFCNLN